MADIFLTLKFKIFMQMVHWPANLKNKNSLQTGMEFLFFKYFFFNFKCEFGSELLGKKYMI